MIIISQYKNKKRKLIQTIVINVIKETEYDIAPQQKMIGTNTSVQLTSIVSFVCFLLFFSSGLRKIGSAQHSTRAIGHVNNVHKLTDMQQRGPTPNQMSLSSPIVHSRS